MRKRNRGSIALTGALLAACSSSNHSTATVAPTVVQTPPEHESYYLKQFSFAFAENAVRYKTEVIATINDLAQHDPRCIRVDTRSLISTSERRSSDPLMQVVCVNAAGQERAVQFHAKDVINHPLPSETASLKQADALRECNLNASIRLQKPVTVDPSFVFETGPDYRSRLTGTVSYNGGKKSVSCHFVGNEFRGVSFG